MHLDYQKDIRFISNIPQGGGLGSSGSVTAAFYDRYVYNELSLESQLDEVRRVLSDMESYFHGESSGVDPLVSLTGKSYVVQNGKGELRDFEIPHSLPIHLILTTAIRNTAPLISYFIESLEKKKFKTAIENKLIPTVHDFVSSWVKGRISGVEQSFKSISAIEFDIFKPMISREIKSLWKEGLETEKFAIKLCGAGGGGAYLALGELPEELKLKTLRLS